MYPLFLYARHEPLSGIPFDTGCRPFDIPQNRSDGMKPILNEGFSEKSCLLLLENSKGNQGNRTKITIRDHLSSFMKISQTNHHTIILGY